MASSDEGRDQHVVDSEEFARILTKQAVAHICVALGFTVTTSGALECLTDVAQQYLEDMAKRAMESTHRAGRTEANLADVLQGLQQMPIPVDWTELRDFAFSEDGRGGSLGGRALAAGGAEEGRHEELAKRWDQPFHNTVPSFPLPRKRPALWGEPDEDAAEGKGEGTGGSKQGREGGGQKGKKVRPPHLPPFMPSLPPSAGGTATEGFGKKLGEVRLERLKRQRQSEAALRSLGIPVTSTGDGASSSSASSAASVPAGGGEGGLSKKVKGKGKRSLEASASTPNGPARIRADASGSGTGEEKKPRLSLKLGNGVVARANQQGPPSGIRAIPPNAAGASLRLGSSEVKGAADGTPGGAGSGGVGNGMAFKGSGAGPRGAFGRPSDSTREERILEGIPPDGPQGDVDGAA